MARRYSLAVAVVMVSLTGAATIGAPPPADTTTTLTIVPNPVVVGSASPTITALSTFDEGGAAVNAGRLRIKRLLDPLGSGAQVACGTVGALEDDVAVEEPTDGTLVFNGADTSLIGSFGYVAQLVPASSGGGDVKESQSGCFNLNVIPPPCTGLQVAATAATGTGLPLPGTTWTGGFEISVTNCGPGTAYGVTAQGGSSGWTTVTGIAPDTGLAGIKSSKGKSSTQIIQWAIGDMAAGAVAKIVVSESGFIKPNTASGTILFLNGPWSAQTAGIKTDYTDRITITVP